MNEVDAAREVRRLERKHAWNAGYGTGLYGGSGLVLLGWAAAMWLGWSPPGHPWWGVILGATQIGIAIREWRKVKRQGWRGP